MILSLIVAYSKDAQGRLVIGKDNSLPWHLPHDLARFREHTLNNAVLMGRKTYESIGRVLPRRENIILSRDPNFKVRGAQTFTDLNYALEFASIRNHEVFVIGGQQIYEQTLPRVQRLYLTEIKERIEGDTFFPNVDLSKFKVMYEENRDTDKFRILERLHRDGAYNPHNTESSSTISNEDMPQVSSGYFFGMGV